MASHFHLEDNNNIVVNNNTNIRLDTTRIDFETKGRPLTNYMSVDASPPTPHPNSQISVENNVKNNDQNNHSVPFTSTSPDSNTLGALKEWAVVCDAIETGDQILLFRKGGIMEYRNGFELKFKDFFLFPTFEHQARESIRPQYHAVLDQLEKNNDSSTSIKNYTKVTSFVEITHFSEVPSLDRLKALEDFHIWTDEYVKTRFNYNSKKPLYLLLLRAYKLKKPIQIMNKPQWIGCKSWIQIDSHDQDLDLYFENNSPENPFEYLKSISNPCIDDNKFNKLSEKVRSII